MSRGNDYRAPRRRGFDDDSYSQPSYGQRDSRGPSSYGGAAGGGGRQAQAPSGPAIDASVKWFNPEKGFGFVELSDGSGDAFLHINTLQNAGHEAVEPGTKLKVQVGQGMKGAQVMSVLEVDASTAQPNAPRGGAGGAPRGAAPRGRPQIDHSTATEAQGVVKWFNATKGFGFATCDDGLKDVFIHASVVEAAGLGTLAEGQQVTMKIVETPKGREAVALISAR